MPPLLAVTLLAVAPAIAGCGGDDEDGGGGAVVTVTQTETATVPATESGPRYPARSPEKALDELLDRILADERYRSEGFRDGSFVTPRFIARIGELEAEARAQGLPGLDADPFLCAQQLPERVTYEPGAITGDTAAVVAVFDYGGPAPERKTYRMKLVDDRWKLDSNECVT